MVYQIKYGQMTMTTHANAESHTIVRKYLLSSYYHIIRIILLWCIKWADESYESLNSQLPIESILASQYFRCFHRYFAERKSAGKIISTQGTSRIMFNKKNRKCGTQPNEHQLKKVKLTLRKSAGNQRLTLTLVVISYVATYPGMLCSCSNSRNNSSWRIATNINQKVPNSVLCCVIAQRVGFQANARSMQLNCSCSMNQPLLFDPSINHIVVKYQSMRYA